jgi:hypothetical protein
MCDINSGSLSPGCTANLSDGGRGLKRLVGASAVGRPMLLTSSLILTVGVEIHDVGEDLAFATCRSGVDAAGSFFLPGRLAAPVDCNLRAELEAGHVLAAGVGGGTTCGWEVRAARASASERWFANVFWESRILRTAGVTLPWLTIDVVYVS